MIYQQQKGGTSQVPKASEDVFGFPKSIIMSDKMFAF